MHDIRAIRDNPQAFDAAMARRGLSGVSAEVLGLDEARRAAISQAEALQAKRNTASKKVGAAKAAGDQAEFERLRAEVAETKDEIARIEDEVKARDKALFDLLAGLPNVLYDDVPQGETKTTTTRSSATAARAISRFNRSNIFDIPAARGLDFATAAKLSGSRFVVMRGAMARLHRTLAQFMLDLHTGEHGLTEMITPVLVRDEIMFGTNQLPKFAEDSYQTTNGWWLIPTSEVTLTNTVAGDILDAADLPLPHDLSHPLLPLRSRLRRQGYGGHVAPSPV